MELLLSIFTNLAFPTPILIAVLLASVVAGGIGAGWKVRTSQKEYKAKKNALQRIIDNGRAKSRTIDEMVDDVSEKTNALCNKIDKKEADDFRNDLAKLLQIHATAYADWGSAMQRSKNVDASTIEQTVQNIQEALNGFVAYESSIGGLNRRVTKVSRELETFTDRIAAFVQTDSKLVIANDLANDQPEAFATISKHKQTADKWYKQALEKHEEGLFLAANTAVEKAEQAMQEAIDTAKNMGIFI